MQTDTPRLGSRFALALMQANRLHEKQIRKGGGDQPYISHLLGVTAIVLDYGGDEDQAIVALLHDAMEDQGLTEGEIEALYGPRVRAGVVGCTDRVAGEAVSHRNDNWRARKQAYLDHLPEATLDVLVVSLADKLYNCQSIVRDLRQGVPNFWTRFRAGEAETRWYYHALGEAFDQGRARHADNRMLQRLIADYKIALNAFQINASSDDQDTGVVGR